MGLVRLRLLFFCLIQLVIPVCQIYFQVVVVEFFASDSESEGNPVTSDVCLSKWIIGYDPETNEGETWWPPKAALVSRYLAKNKEVDRFTWKKEKIRIIRWCGKFPN